MASAPPRHWYWLAGAGFGATFPVVGTFLEIGLRGLEWSPSGVLAAQVGQPLLWIIDGAPLVLALFAAAIGRRQTLLNQILAGTADTRLAQAVERFFDLSPDPMAIIDFEGRLRQVNRSFERILGYTRSSVQQMSVFDLVHEDDVERVEERHRRLRLGERPDNAELRVRTSTGEMRIVEWSSVPLVEEQVMYAVGRDVTVEREVQSALGIAREHAEAARAAKDEFLANMSHEIRTPMHGVLGMIELLFDTELTGQQREFLEAAGTSAQHLHSVLEDLLDFSAVETGKLALHPAPFRLSETLREPLKAMAVRARRKGLDLVYSEGATLPEHLIGDHRRITQILLNLVDNAIKFTESGTVSVATGLEGRAGPLATVSVTVRDTGIGFDAQVQSRIFEAFSQGDGSHTRRFGGTGLGLAIGSRLASMMGGALTAESEEGVGSVFRLELTLPVEDRQERSQSRFEAPGRRALVVYSSPLGLRTLTEYLGRAGIDCTSATSVTQAVAVAEYGRQMGQPHDLVLIDLTDVAVEDLSLARRLIEAPECGPMAAVWLTGDATLLPDRRGWEPLSPFPILRLPVFPDELFQAVQSVLHPEAHRTTTIGTEVEKPSPTSLWRSALVVEDNPVNQVLVTMMLRKRGYRVTSAADGVEAVDHVRREQFDIILMDVQMPNMDGLQATRAIRALERDRARRVPIIAVTAHAHRGDRERCLDAGMDDYVVKPINPVELDAALQRHIDGEAEDFLYQRAVELASGDPDLVTKLLEVHVEEAPRKLVALRDALRTHDPTASSAVANDLEETASSLAMPHLRDLAHQIAVLSRNGEFERATQLLTQLEAVVTRSANIARSRTGAA